MDMGLVLVLVIPTALLVGCPSTSTSDLTGMFTTGAATTSALISAGAGALRFRTSKPAWPLPGRTQLANTEMQLRVQSRRFEVAQVQLQVQAEKTATAKAQLAVERVRCQIRQLDIDLELKQAASATAKSDRDAARDAARGRPGCACCGDQRPVLLRRTEDIYSSMTAPPDRDCYRNVQVCLLCIIDNPEYKEMFPVARMTM